MLHASPAPELQESCSSPGRRGSTRPGYRRFLWLASPYCRYCGQRIPKRRSSLDHIRPRSKGGDNSTRNLVLACKRCNRRKDDATPLQLVVWSLRVLAVAVAVKLGKAVRS